MRETIVYRGTTRLGKSLLIRYPAPADLRSLWQYINSLSRERTFISYQGKKVSIREEREFLTKSLEQIKNREAVMFVAMCSGELAGVSKISIKKRAENHVGVLGISIAKKFRGEGVGRKLLNMITTEAKKKLRGLKIVELTVFANNSNAISLYRKLGFKKYGVLPRGASYRNKHVDVVSMYKNL